MARAAERPGKRPTRLCMSLGTGPAVAGPARIGFCGPSIDVCGVSSTMEGAQHAPVITTAFPQCRDPSWNPQIGPGRLIAAGEASWSRPGSDLRPSSRRRMKRSGPGMDREMGCGGASCLCPPWVAGTRERGARADREADRIRSRRRGGEAPAGLFDDNVGHADAGEGLEGARVRRGRRCRRSRFDTRPMSLDGTRS